jgi:predicted amidophosphoribosyltransferase
MIKLLKKIKNIFVGNFKRIKGEELSDEGKRRLNICMQCEDKIKISRNEYVCKHCGCPIKSKNFVLDEECYLNK